MSDSPLEFPSSSTEDELENAEQDEIFEGANELEAPKGMENLQDELFPVSGEPEEVEAPGVPLPQVTLQDAGDTGHLTALVCDSCLELNLLTKSTIKCVRCDAAFCFHYASTVDAQYCVNCMSEIAVTKQVVTKTYTHKHDDGRVVYYRRRAREIRIDGLDWLFAQRKINTLQDVELDLAIEYHRNICGLMISEQERRRSEKMHRYAGMAVKVPSPSSINVKDTTTTTVKKTRTISKNKASEQVAALLAAMTAKGVSMDQIAALLKK